MADLSTSVDLIFRGINQTGPGIDDVVGGFAKLAAGAGAVAAPLAAITTTLISAEKAAISFALSLGNEAFDAAVKLESSTLELSKVWTKADGDIEEFTASLADNARTYGVATTELVESAANFKQAGFSAQESGILIKDALDLVIAGNLDASQASDLLVASLKGFNLPATEARTVIDLLNEVSNNYATNLEELIIGFSDLSPVAKQAGLSINQTAGLLTPAIEVFRSGSEASRAFRTILSRLADPTKEIEGALAQLGVSTKNANGEFRFAGEILFDVAKAFGNVAEEQKANLSAIIAGKDQAGKFAATMDNFNKILAISSDEFVFLGSAAREVEERFKSTQVAIDRQKVAYQQLLVVIGKEYQKELKGVIDSTAGLTNVFREQIAGGALEGVFDLIRAQLEAISAAVTTVTANLPEALAGVDFTKLEDSLSNLRESVLATFNFDITTVEGLQKVLQLAVDGFATLTNFTAGYIDQHQGLISALVTVAEAFAGADEETVLFAGSVGAVAEKLGGLFNHLDTLLLLLIAAKAGAFGAGAGMVAFATATSQLVAAAAGSAALTGGLVLQSLTLGDAVKALGGDESLPLIARLMEKFGIASFDAIKPLGGFADELDRLNSTDQDAFLADLNQQFDEFNNSRTAFDLNDEIGQLEAFAGAAAAMDAQLAENEAQLSSFANAVEQMSDGLEVSNKDFEESNKKIVEWGVGGNKAFDTLSELAGAAGKVGVQFDTAADRFVAVDQITDELSGTTQRLIGTYTDAQGKIVNVYETIGEASTKELSKADEAIDKQIQKTKEYQLKLLELASNERIKTIEAIVEFNIAQVEADAKKVVAAFESIDTTIESTGGVITDLFATFANLDRFDQLKILQQIAKEDQRRQEALDLQKRLVEQQIRLMEAQIRRYNSSDTALIKIDGTGLEPQLNAFMFAVLNGIQVEVNNTYRDFLLGLNIPLTTP